MSTLCSLFIADIWGKGNVQSQSIILPSQRYFSRVLAAKNVTTLTANALVFYQQELVATLLVHSFRGRTNNQGIYFKYISQASFQQKSITFTSFIDHINNQSILSIYLSGVISTIKEYITCISFRDHINNQSILPVYLSGIALTMRVNATCISFRGWNNSLCYLYISRRSSTESILSVYFSEIISIIKDPILPVYISGVVSTTKVATLERVCLLSEAEMRHWYFPALAMLSTETISSGFVSSTNKQLHS